MTERLFSVKKVTAVSVGGSIKTKEALKDLSVEDVDFTAQFPDEKWTVKWVYERKPEISNNVSQ